MFVFHYCLEEIDFRPWACETLSVDRLEDLHLKPDPEPFANYVERMTYYAGLLKGNFEAVNFEYLQLLNLVGTPFDGLVPLQTSPSFRCHLSGSGTASAFHRDGDPKYGVRPGAINGWVPLTAVRGNNSIYIESTEGLEDYKAASLGPGEILIFDAFHLKHGSYANDTQSTRVSFDFRFLPGNIAKVDDVGFEQPTGLSKVSQLAEPE